jgi:peptidoglycan/LPS O-acetylase OafA/YrhL
VSGDFWGLDMTAGRYAHIDAMRAMAAMMVAIIHVAEVFADKASGGLWLGELSHDFNIGHIGVALFFIVSGFVVPASLGNADDRVAGLRTFAIRRFFRLYPAYWVSIALAVVAISWLQSRQPDLATVLANLTMVPAWMGFPTLQGLYWTLHVELIFYAACAALYGVGWLHRPGALVAVLMGLIVWFVLQETLGLRSGDGDIGMNDLPVHLGLMFTGTLLRFWHDGQPLSRWVKWVLIAILVVYIAPVVRGFRLSDGDFAIRFTSDSSRAVAVILFLLFAMRARLSHPALSWLGTISYSVYLLHMVCAYFWLWLIGLPALGILQGWDLPATVAAVFCLTLVVSAAVYRWVELPTINLGRRLSRRGALADGIAQPRPYA